MPQQQPHHRVRIRVSPNELASIKARSAQSVKLATLSNGLASLAFGLMRLGQMANTSSTSKNRTPRDAGVLS